MPVTAKNQHRKEAQHARQASDGQAKPKQEGIPDMNSAQTEEEKIAAMFAADASSWEQQKEQMAKYVTLVIYLPGHLSAFRTKH